MPFGVLLLLLSSCADPPPAPSADKGRLFVDVAAEAGLHRTHRGGTPEKGYIIEAKGGGLAVLDAEGDGDLDLYWVNGAALDDSLGAGNAPVSYTHLTLPTKRIV